MGIFSEIFSWWGGNTWGTRLTIARHGRYVGDDSFGNRYYEQIKGVGPEGPLGRLRRWVTYTKLADPSKVPPEWHGWLHKSTDVLPSESTLPRKAWEKPHRANLSGTAGAWHRPGALTTDAPRARATGDYEAWSPDEA